MDAAALTARLKEHARGEGFDAVGVADAVLPTRDRNALSAWLARGRHAGMEWMARGSE